MKRQILRVNCMGANCAQCTRVQKTKKTLFGETKYKCPERKLWHGEVQGYRCLGFRCGKQSHSMLCEDCTRGE